ncbi:MAG: hypothetical protein K2N06_09225 [Oscillospiraceae bacterium]|nr:hypothetical protein [Oscillospiraceae bacterium]
MQLFKKIAALVLCLASLFCCFVTASADTAATVSDETPIGILTIHSAPRFSNSQGGSSSSSSEIDAGHAFLSLKNTTWQSIRLGGINVAPGAECTIGTWDISAHQGIWYNLESYAINHKGKMPNRVSLSMPVSSVQLERINSYIDSHDSWSLLRNCADFAGRIWNSVSMTKLTGDTPSNLAKSINGKLGSQINSPVPDASFYGYVDGLIFRSVNPANIITDATTSTVMIVPIEEDVSL